MDWALVSSRGVCKGDFGGACMSCRRTGGGFLGRAGGVAVHLEGSGLRGRAKSVHLSHRGLLRIMDLTISRKRIAYLDCALGWRNPCSRNARLFLGDRVGRTRSPRPLWPSLRTTLRIGTRDLVVDGARGCILTFCPKVGISHAPAHPSRMQVAFIAISGWWNA